MDGGVLRTGTAAKPRDAFGKMSLM